MNNHIYLQLISLNKTYNNHFLKRYVKLVSFYKERNWSYKSGLHHEHHIIPESFGGLDTVENLVFITIREHFILHWMLYKAFPNSEMVIAFNMMCNFWRQDFRITSKVYTNAMLEFAKRNSENAKKQVEDGIHPFQDKEKARERVNKLVAEGRHPWQGGEMTRKQLENGTHPSQIKKVCSHCNKEFGLGMFAKYHGDNCKLNPLFVDDTPKIECPHCNRLFLKSHFNLWHGDKCKLNSLFKDDKLKIECEHCKRTFDKTNYKRWHGDNCKLKPQI